MERAVDPVDVPLPGRASSPKADFLQQSPDNAPRRADPGGRMEENTVRSRVDRVMKLEKSRQVGVY
jgi:hypothetical protein